MVLDGGDDVIFAGGYGQGRFIGDAGYMGLPPVTPFLGAFELHFNIFEQGLDLILLAFTPTKLLDASQHTQGMDAVGMHG